MIRGAGNNVLDALVAGGGGVASAGKQFLDLWTRSEGAVSFATHPRVSRIIVAVPEEDLRDETMLAGSASHRHQRRRYPAGFGRTGCLR